MELGDIVLTGIYILTLYYTIFWLLTIFEKKDDRKQELKSYPKVTVVVPAYNEAEHLRASVASLLKLDYPKDKLEVLIVDDGSTDSTFSIAKQIKAANPTHDIKAISVPNKGKWAVLNLGLKQAKGEFFACLDADSFVKHDSLIKALPHFDDETAVVLPLLKVHKPKSFMQKVQWYEYLINMFYKKLIGDLNCIHVAPGPFSIYKKSILKSVGGFRRAHNTEDLEIVLRLQENQYRVKQLLDAEVYTAVPEGLKGIYTQRYRWFRGSFLNAWDYRRLILRPKYGDFGIFQLPIVLVTGFLAVALIGVTLYLSLIKPLWNGLMNLSLINFDIFTLLSSFSFNFSFLDFNFYKLSIMLFFLSLSAVVVFLAHRYTSERVMKHGIKSMFFFVFFYYLTLAAVWIGLFVNMLLRKESKW